MNKQTRITCTGGGPFDGAAFVIEGEPERLHIWTPFRRTTYVLLARRGDWLWFDYESGQDVVAVAGDVSRAAVKTWQSHDTTGSAMIGMRAV